jgi:hypothetical protein
VIPFHVKVKIFEVLQLFCLDLIDLGYFREDLATFVESEHVIQIDWALRDPIHTYDRENIQGDTNDLKVCNVAHELEISDDQYLMDYVYHEET